MSATVTQIDERSTTVDALLHELLAYEEIYGALAVNSEGLVLGSSGLVESDIDVISLMGASLVGVSERAAHRLGTRSPIGLSVVTEDGMITIRNGGTFALMVFSTQCDSMVLLDLLREPMYQVRQILAPSG
jgi:predicted regulator of Ras-like GTPase activity (Roadblock/LC7/MglB family)